MDTVMKPHRVPQQEMKRDHLPVRNIKDANISVSEDAAEMQEAGEEFVETLDSKKKEFGKLGTLRIEHPLAGQDIRIYCPGVVLAVGRPNSGKTHMARYLMRELVPYFNHGLVICPNATAEEEYDWCPRQFLAQSYSEQLVQDFMDFQENTGTKLAFLIFDDCLGSAEFGGHVLQKLFTQFRKYGLFIMVIVQSIAKVVPPVIRQCFTHEYFFQTEEERVIDVMAKSFLNRFFPDKKTLASAIVALPEHTCFWKDNENGTLNIVRAPKDIPEFWLPWTTIMPSKKEEDAEGDAAKDPSGLAAEKARLRQFAEGRMKRGPENPVPAPFVPQQNARWMAPIDRNTKIKELASYRKRPRDEDPQSVIDNLSGNSRAPPKRLRPGIPQRIPGARNPPGARQIPSARQNPITAAATPQKAPFSPGGYFGDASPYKISPNKKL